MGAILPIYGKKKKMKNITKDTNKQTLINLFIKNKEIIKAIEDSYYAVRGRTVSLQQYLENSWKEESHIVARENIGKLEKVFFQIVKDSAYCIVPGYNLGEGLLVTDSHICGSEYDKSNGTVTIHVTVWKKYSDENSMFSNNETFYVSSN